MKDKYKETIYNLVHLSKAKMEDDGVFIDRKKLQEDINVLWELYNKYQELADKKIPKKLKQKTDKDGRLLLVCPNCGDVYKKFWSDVETISCRKHCDECGQKLDWSDE